jgi:hypothetical protein
MTDEIRKPKLVIPDEIVDQAHISVPKPGDEFNLDEFKSETLATAANVGTLLTALPVARISEAKDFVRLHSDEQNYWSPELCFVNVPVKGQKRDTLHLISEPLAKRFLSPKRILRFRLALATKPHDVYVLCQVPSQNTDNSWNLTNLQACEYAKTRWVMVTSRKDEGFDSYKIDFAHDEDAFPSPKWPSQSLNEIISRTFEGRKITTEDHPGLLRLIGAKQSVS